MRGAIKHELSAGSIINQGDLLGSLELKERRRHSADEAASRRALSQYKRCPKCKVYLDKNGGCNHFTCRACRHEFCWDCGKPWSGSACRNTWCASRRR